MQRKEQDMRRTVAKVVHKGTYRVVYDDAKHINPYTIYHETYDIDADFQSHHRMRKVESYGNLASCLCHLTDIVSA